MARGGKRVGAGKKKGIPQQRTLEKLAVLSAFRQRVMLHADNLFTAQYSKAIGSIQIFRIDEIEIGENKTKKMHTLVTDSDEIKAVLDATANGESTEGVYFVTEIPPDNKAIDSMFDRTFGKAQQSIDIQDSTDPQVIAIKHSIQTRADEKGISYQAELQNYVKYYALPEIKEKLVSEMEN